MTLITSDNSYDNPDGTLLMTPGGCEDGDHSVARLQASNSLYRPWNNDFIKPKSCLGNPNNPNNFNNSNNPLVQPFNQLLSS